MENNFCLIIALQQEQKIEIAVNTHYFKRAFYDSYSNDILLVLEFADFKIYHQCNKKINLNTLLHALKGNEIDLQNLEN